ncbi:MAG: coproporphyrinogen III oxidase [Alphaproteobacteria bacterium]|nr:coproporphyrinogen III oxidase [Alphaproteobacteria bacterium]
MLNDWRNGGFGIYIHWPFCESKCPYCDFNSHVVAEVDQRSWAQAFVSELERYSEELPERIVNSVFFGGGTPSLMSPELVETVLACIAENWRLANDVEITLEANPSSVEAGKFRDFQASGINRVSLGVQSLNDHDLRRLGRRHTAQEAREAIEIAQKAFLRVSFDLIYARQEQTIAEWRAELTQALAFGTEHLSLYQLTIENNTAFGRLNALGKLRGLPADDLAADLYNVTQEICGAHDLPAYEVSNHAKPYAQSRHNLIYWRGGDYIGIGPGSHGRITVKNQRFTTSCCGSPSVWLDQALAGKTKESRSVLSKTDRAIEYVMMGLRLDEGLSVDRLLDMCPSVLASKNIELLQEIGHLEVSENALRVTPSGRMVLNAITGALLEQL